MKYEYYKKYLLYKYYASFITTTKFIPKSINNMSNKELHKYLLQLKILYNYSKKCYILRKEYRDLCIKEYERDIGHEIAISITKQYNYDILQVINKIITKITKQSKNNIIKFNHNIFSSFESENQNENESESESENENENNLDIKKNCKKVNKLKVIETDDELLDKIILEKQKIVNTIFSALEEKFNNYKLKSSISLLYMSLQYLSLSKFNIIFNKLNDDKKMKIHNIIIDINKYDLVKLIIDVKRTYFFNNDDNIDNIIYFDVSLKGESIKHPTFFNKNIKINFIIQLLYMKLIFFRIREKDREQFIQIIGDRILKLTKNLNSRANALDPDKYVYELINDNDRLYLYVDN